MNIFTFRVKFQRKKLSMAKKKKENETQMRCNKKSWSLGNMTGQSNNQKVCSVSVIVGLKLHRKS
jgi:hypothetical protein